jgi:hypothetical protein
LAEREQYRGAIGAGGRLVEGAGEQRGRAGGVAEGQRVAGGVPQYFHRGGVAGRRGVNDRSSDLVSRRSAFAEDRDRGKVQPLALGG